MTGEPEQPKPIFRCRRFWLIAMPVLSISLLLAVFCVLRFGYPQWHRYIFMFQAFVSPGNARTMVVPTLMDYNIVCTTPAYRGPLPSRYTGVWRTWNKSGQLQSHDNYVNGLLQGKAYSWFSSSSWWGRTMYWERTYKDDVRHGFSFSTYWGMMSLDEDGFGTWKEEGNYVNGKKHGKWVHYRTNDTTYTVEYDMGKRLTPYRPAPPEDALQIEEQDPTEDNKPVQ